jgi:hypothetical protein
MMPTQAAAFTKVFDNESKCHFKSGKFTIWGSQFGVIGLSTQDKYEVLTALSGVLSVDGTPP